MGSMIPSLTDFRAKFPEFSDVADGRMEELLEESFELHNRSTKATLYLAAHLAALDEAERLAGAIAPVDGGGGVFASENPGPVSFSYQTQIVREGRDVYFSRTPYGRRFLALERRVTSFSVFIA